MLITVSGTTGHQAHGAAGVDDTLKDFWTTRPRRPRKGRKFAGVAAGIGYRYGIDPVIVRVAFVVAAFYGGAGIVLYLLGWLFLPEQDDEVSPFESMISRGRSSTSTFFTVLLCLALIPTVGWFFDGGWFFPGYITLALAGVGLFLLHRNRGHLNRPAPSPPPVPDGWASAPMAPMTAASTEATSPVADPTATPTPEQPTQPAGPPAWDPLGAAPFAWDLPEPSPPAPEPPAPRRRSKVGPITVGVALVVLGVSALLSSDPWFSPRHVIGLLLGVIGAGLFVGSFVRGGRGLIGLAVPLSVVGIAMTAVQIDDYRSVGEIKERPESISAVQSNYERSVGTVELDLSAVRESAGELETEVRVNLGDVTVTVPETADVELDCHAGLGSVECLSKTADGGDANVKFDEDNPDLGTDGKGGLKIKLDVEVGTGSVEVRRG